MGKDSSIEWTTHTHNLWSSSPRRFFKDAHYKQPLAWNRAAERAGEQHRVLCGSRMDLFKEYPNGSIAFRMAELSDQLFFDIIPATPHLDWLLLTKRLENVLEMVPFTWHRFWPSNAWLGFSASTQGEFDAGVLELAYVCSALEALPPVRFVSLEPLLGLVDISGYIGPCKITETVREEFGVPVVERVHELPCLLNWTIVGGESGKDARPMHPDWARRVRDDCVAAGIPYFLKQWGEWLPADQYQDANMELGYYDLSDDHILLASDGHVDFFRVGKKRAGAILDGREWRQVPEVKYA